MPPVVVSIELLNKKGIYWCKKDITQKMEVAPAAKNEGNPTAINLTQSNVHIPGFWIVTINRGSASMSPIKVGNDAQIMKSSKPLLQSFLRAISYALAHTMEHPTNTTYKK